MLAPPDTRLPLHASISVKAFAQKSLALTKHYAAHIT